MFIQNVDSIWPYHLQCDILHNSKYTFSAILALYSYYSHLSSCEVELAHKERKCDWTASWRAQFVGGLTRVELQSFEDGCKVVTHTFDIIFAAQPPTGWTKRQKRAWCEKRKFEQLRNSEGEEVVKPGKVGGLAGDGEVCWNLDP